MRHGLGNGSRKVVLGFEETQRDTPAYTMDSGLTAGDE